MSELPVDELCVGGMTVSNAVGVSMLLGVPFCSSPPPVNASKGHSFSSTVHPGWMMSSQKSSSMTMPLSLIRTYWFAWIWALIYAICGMSVGNFFLIKADMPCYRQMSSSLERSKALKIYLPCFDRMKWTSKRLLETIYEIDLLRI